MSVHLLAEREVVNVRTRGIELDAGEVSASDRPSTKLAGPLEDAPFAHDSQNKLDGPRRASGLLMDGSTGVGRYPGLDARTGLRQACRS
jgi:hypothetical protein